MDRPIAWHFWVRGRWSTRYQLADEHGRELGELDRHGWDGSHARTTDPDGTVWELATEPMRTTAQAAGRVVVVLPHVPATDRADPDAGLRVADRRFALRLATDGSRTAVATDDRGAVVLDARPSPHRGGPFLDLVTTSALPEPFATAMTVAFALVAIDAQMRSGWAGGSSGGGP